MDAWPPLQESGIIREAPGPASLEQYFCEHGGVGQKEPLTHPTGIY
jgi:hypothetical protein